MPCATIAVHAKNPPRIMLVTSFCQPIAFMPWSALSFPRVPVVPWEFGRDSTSRNISLLAGLVPVMDQVDAGDDIHDLSVGYRQDACVASHQEAIGFVQVDGGFELWDGTGHH